MSETETRHGMLTADDNLRRWTRLCSACDAGMGACSCPRDDPRPLVEQLWHERDDARVELSRLRAVVEAVQALAGRIATTLAAGCPSCGPGDCDHVVGYHKGWQDALDAIRAALAPVSSSGEAESGEAAPGGWLCRHGKYRSEHWCDDHLDHERRMQTTAPAPVPSGGQADGEAVDAILTEHFGHTVYEATRDQLEECHDECPACLAGEQITALLAARPVLSREALADANDALHKLSAWIDAGNAHRDPEAVTWGRLAKITEEAGEAIAAYIGMTGQNPRKGVTHSLTSVQEELLDVAVTALGAVAHLNGNDGEDVLALLRSKIERVAERALHAEVLTAGGEQA